MSERKQILKNSRAMVMVTTVSRVFGLLRDQLIAFLLGATRLGDIWAVSFMIPNLFRRLIGEGAMSSAFVPILTELNEENGHPGKAVDTSPATQEFVRTFFSLILVLSCLIVTVMVLVLPWVLPFLLGLMKPGKFGADPEIYQQMIGPTRLMFPYLIFISLASVCQGVLNVNNRFALPAATPIVLNICVIVFGFGLMDRFDSPIWGLCVGVLVGGFFQLFLQWMKLRQMGFRIAPSPRLRSKRTGEAMRLWLPTTFSAGIAQINALISGMIAVNLIEGGAMALQTSTRLMELILGVFTVALSTTLLPAFSRQRTRRDLAGLNESLWSGLSLMSLITIPAAMGLILAGPSLISILFERGAFDERGVALTFTALIFHGMALVPISWHRILVQIFYAHKQVKAAVWIAVSGAVINIVGCFTFPTFFDAATVHCGVALATLVSSWSIFFVSIFEVKRRFQLIWPRALSKELAKMLLAALAFVPFWYGRPPTPLNPLLFLLLVLVSVLVYAILVWLFRVKEVRRLVGG